MVQSFKARQMQPGHDTISVMAMHYGFKPSKVTDIIKQAGAEVIREDGFRSKLLGAMVSKEGKGKVRAIVWTDGVIGVNPDKTRLTKDAIKAVSLWAFRQQQAKQNESDN